MFRIRLRQLREDHGYRSQQAFAKEFGVAQTTVASWEGGTREPSLDTIYRLADFFGVTVGYLLGKEKSADISADGLSSDDMELWELFQAATPEKKAAIRALLK